MKKFFLALVFFFIFLILTFFMWRRKAPNYEGQDLHPKVSVGTSAELILVGDMGTGGEDQKRLAAAMNTYCESHPLAAIIFLGDNFYPHGVKTTEDPQWESIFRTPYGLSCLKNIPFYALLGNHDYKGNPSAQIAYHSKSPEWNMPHRFYDLQFGKLLSLTMLDTNILDICGLSSYCTLDFLRESLKTSDSNFKIVLGHHPIVSSSSKYPRNFQGNVLERILCDQAHYYIAGHSHHLEHLTAGNCKTPLDLFIVGGGGADLYEVKEWQKETRFAQSAFGFMSLKVDAESLTFTFHDPALKKLYEVTKRKSEETQAAEAPPKN
ncbi:MAG: metallophosphoesterase [Bdellovibrionota bacterium]